MFKEAFKYYKRKKPPPDLTKVIEFSENDENTLISRIRNNDVSINLSAYGLIPARKWEIYCLNNKEGLIIIKNPFAVIGQRYWISRCLREYSRKPHRLNIDAHNYLKNNENWWEVCQNEKNREVLFRQLRWATLGYHHNWDTKVYSESSKTEFPEDLAKLCKCVANVVGFKEFEAQAAIVNYYHMDSTLSGHTDHSEENLEAPLFSFSFGQSAIFLIGGITEDCPATSLFLHSGDILIMSKESRLCYHAVPKIICAPSQPWNKSYENTEIEIGDNFNQAQLSTCTVDELWKPFDKYIQKSRININVRQVLKNGQVNLSK